MECGTRTTSGTGVKRKCDVFGRLVRVQKWSVADTAWRAVAEYRYNGPGYRIATHRPWFEDAAAAVDESHLWRYNVCEN